MLHEIQELDCGVLFDNDGLDKFKVPIDCVRRIPNPEFGTKEAQAERELMRPQVVIPSWEEADKIDITAEMYDKLKIHPILWLLQIPSWTGRR